MTKQFVRHGSNGLLIGLCLAAMAAGAPGQPAFVLLGAALFYATEYGTHRFLFHARPSRFGWLRAKQHRLHYDHHLEPSRLDLLFLPWWYVLPNLALTVLLGWAVLGSLGRAVAVALGAMLALLHYEWVHFAAHQPYVPRTAMGRWMKRYHLRHHFVNEKLWFGVSNPVTDVVAGTYRRVGDVERSATTRVLH